MKLAEVNSDLEVGFQSSDDFQLPQLMAMRSESVKIMIIQSVRQIQVLPQEKTGILNKEITREKIVNAFKKPILEFFS